MIAVDVQLDNIVNVGIFGPNATAIALIVASFDSELMLAASPVKYHENKSKRQ